MAEYFVVANSFAAPLISDQSTEYVQGESPADALERFAAEYKHPAGLYAAALYESADAYHKINRCWPNGSAITNKSSRKRLKTSALTPIRETDRAGSRSTAR